MKVYFNNDPNNFPIQISMYRKKVNSNGSRKSYVFKPLININYNIKNRHLFLKKSNAGRLSNGRIGVYSKSSLISKILYPRLNYFFRDNRAMFISNIIYIPGQNKFVSSVLLSSGLSTYLPTTTDHKLFFIFMSLRFKKKDRDLLNSALKIIPSLNIVKYITTVINSPKNKPVSLIEHFPGKGIQYIRSSGSSGKILKVDSRTGLSLIQLPSGAEKVCSIYSLCSKGSVLPSDSKKYRPNKAGFYSRLGKKPSVRGVAMNPVDHPHGGRTKSIKYPRTPWGFTAKLKN